MDFHWYFPPHNSGGGGGTIIVEGTDYKTITIPVSSNMRTAECRITDIQEYTFGWNKQAVEIINGVESEVEIGEVLEFETYSDNSQTAYFQFSWQNAFTGYININYWNKNS